MNEWDTIALSELNSIETIAGAYAFIVDETVVYIGRSKMLGRRLHRHKLLKSLIKECAKVIVKVSCAWKTYDKEKELIIKYKPRYNCEHINKHSAAVN